MSAVLESVAWVGCIWMAVACVAAWAVHRTRRRPPLPTRTPADVWNDVDTQRAARQLRQAIDDNDAVWAIWPDPPNAHLIELQHRLDTAKQRKDEDR